MISPVSLAQTQRTMLGNWIWTEKPDELTNIVEYTAALKSTNTVFNAIGVPEKALMLITCDKKKEPRISVVWPDFVERESALVSWKFDENEIKRTSWDSYGATNVEVPITRLPGFLDDLFKSQKLVIQIATQNAVFELEGGNLVVDQVFDVCRIRGFLARPKARAETSTAVPSAPANAAPVSPSPSSEQKAPPVTTQS